MPEDPLDNAALLRRSLERARALEANDPEIARMRPLSEVLDSLPDCRSAAEIFKRVCEAYADRPALGSRAYRVVPDDELGRSKLSYQAHFDTITYHELWHRTVRLATGWHEAGLADAGSFVGICAFGSPDFVLAEMSCLYLGAVSVPLQTSLTPADLAQIIRDAGISCLVASRDQLELVASVVPECPSVRSVGVIDWHVEASSDVDLFERVKDQLATHGRRLWNLAELEALGHQVRVRPMHTPAEGLDPLVTLIYTSGSTGLPKGAVYPDSLWRQTWLRTTRFGRLPVMPQLTVSYLPINHFMGRGSVIATLARGGLVNFTLAPDMSTLFEDIRLVRPTSLSLVPRVAEMIHQHYLIELARRGEEQADAIREEMGQSFLGDRLLWANIGSAPTSPEVLRFLKRCFQVPILEGYGSTEAGVITFDGRIVEDAIVDYKLIDAPEAGYLTTDVPHPRGQLLIKSRWSVPGYYKSPEATRALYDDDGYLRTGDIVEERAPGELAVVGRVKDVLKLSQGEFVTLWKLEAAFTADSPLIRQVYLYGHSDRAYLVGVVVPDREAVHERLTREGHPMNDDDAKRLVRAELDRVAEAEGLRPFEVPRDFLLEWTPFSKENRLLTETSKMARPRLKARYGPALDRLYDTIERNQLRELSHLRLDPHAPVDTKVRAAAQAILGLQDLDMGRRFTDLGGDSLSAVQLASLLEHVCGVRVPEALILDPALSLAGLARAVERTLQEQTSGRPTFETVHGASATIVRAADLRLDRFLTPDELVGASALAYGNQDGSCLLTGASGFLGRFLVLELLDRLPVGARLYCLVRAVDDAAAERRLRGIFERGDPAMRVRFERLASDRLVALAGDLMRPRFGLTEDTFDRLAGELSLIVHNGALVNHAYAYPQLFEPNVLGTVEAIRLAMRRRLKAVSYLSTVGVVGGARPGGRVSEDIDPGALWAERPVNTGYAVGYATSKWAGEVLVREYHDRTGAPVSVFRPTMILTPTCCPSEINASDLFVRLIAGLIYTGIAPASFYAPSAVKPSFDGIPADFIAEAIAAVSYAMTPSWHLYHVANPQANAGVSLDTVVDWIIAAGYPLERIADHAQWYEEFGRRLRALDELRRAHSPLPILYSWREPERMDRHTGLDNTAFRARVQELLGDEELPGLSETLVRRTLAGMVAHGLIPPAVPRPGAITWAPEEAPAPRPRES